VSSASSPLPARACSWSPASCSCVGMRIWPAGPAAFHAQPEQHGDVQAAKLHNRAGISLKKFRKDLHDLGEENLTDFCCSIELARFDNNLEAYSLYWCTARQEGAAFGFELKG